MMDLAADLERFLDPLTVATDAETTPDTRQADQTKSTARSIILNASSQSGKSTTCAMLAVNQALAQPVLILVASPSQRQSGELFRKIVGTLRSLQHEPEFTF